jgi:hypothetical protein
VRAGMGPDRRRRTAGTVLAAGLGLGVLAGCGTDENGVGGQPVATAEPSPFVGLTLTVSSEVERVLGPRAFTLGGGQGELLVIAQEPGVTVNQATSVTVTGTVREGFDLPRVESEFGFDYDDAQFTEFDGEPYLVATAVDPTPDETGGAGAGQTTATTQPQPTPTETTTTTPTETTTTTPTGG